MINFNVFFNVTLKKHRFLEMDTTLSIWHAAVYGVAKSGTRLGSEQQPDLESRNKQHHSWL